MAKSKTKLKSLYYRRAVWNNQKNKTLEDYMREAHESLSTVGERTFLYRSGIEIRGAKVEDKDGVGMLLQIATCSPGGETSTISTDSSAESCSVEAEKAPDGKDYMDGDIFVLVRKNHVVLCPSRTRESIATTYFHRMLDEMKETVISGTFELDKVTKVSRMELIKKEGVKEIILGSSLYEASILHADKKDKKVSGLKKMIATELESIFSTDPTLKTIQEKENLNIKLSIRFDGQEARSHSADAKFGLNGKQRLAETSSKIINEYKNEELSGFTIVTGSGALITSDSIRVSEPYRVATLGNSLDRVDAWEKLEVYFKHLSATGILST